MDIERWVCGMSESTVGGVTPVLPCKTCLHQTQRTAEPLQRENKTKAEKWGCIQYLSHPVLEHAGPHMLCKLHYLRSKATESALINLCIHHEKRSFKCGNTGANMQ